MQNDYKEQKTNNKKHGQMPKSPTNMFVEMVKHRNKS